MERQGSAVSLSVCCLSLLLCHLHGLLLTLWALLLVLSGLLLTGAHLTALLLLCLGLCAEFLGELLGGQALSCGFGLELLLDLRHLLGV